MSCGEAQAQHAATLSGRRKTCSFCRQEVEWGETSKGKASVFDPETGRNHWITCPNQGDARKAFPAKRS